MTVTLAMRFVVAGTAQDRTINSDRNITVTILGTGTPFVDAERFGAAVLVDAGGKKLLFDCGRGVVIRLKQAGISPEQIDGLFLTHLHSDHVVGIPDLWLSGWFGGRKAPLKMWGPAGTQGLAEHLGKAFAFDIETRSSHGFPREGAIIDAQEVEDGGLYEVGPVRVTAFRVDHGLVKPAFGYRVDHGGHSVVISGDTNFSENLVKFSKGTDCLIHASWSTSMKDDTPASRRSIATAEDAARVFSAVIPKLAVIYHYFDAAGQADAIRAGYRGRFVIGRDLMRIEISSTVTLYQPK